MGHYNFKKDLQDSEESVQRVIKFLTDVGCTNLSINDDGRYDIQYNNKIGQLRTAEIKNDLMYKDTGNVAIEFQSRDKPSGISTSLADIWYYVLGDAIYMARTGHIRVYLVQHWDRFKRVSGGDKGTSLIALLPISEFEQLFVRINGG